MEKYVALLRGINVGGNKKVPMKDLKSLLEKIGFQDVKTVLNSGNVVFSGDNINLKDFASTLETHFGFIIPTILLSFKEYEKIEGAYTFKNVEITPDTRLYVSFLPKKRTSSITIPYISPDDSFRIEKVTDFAVYSVLDVSKKGTVDAMKILEKEFGKDITTRNYNTVQKIAQL